MGYVAAGLGPADRHENIHVVLGALPIFFAGNIGLLVMAASRRSTTSLRVTALVTGLIGLLGTVLFLERHYLGFGMGGMERVAAWPLLIFLAVVGITLLGRTSRGSQ